MNSSRDIQTPWLLEGKRLCVYRGGRPVLNELEFAFTNGECISLIGPNGSGKTTLMMTLLGLLTPARGKVLINNRDLAALSARVRGRFAAYVPQTVERIPAFSVYEVVASGRFPHVSPLRPLTRTDHEHIEQALEICGLSELADRRADSLSGGERQKTLIAAAIAQDAQIMFLDEPNTALDPAYQIELVNLLRNWHARGRSLVLISHDLQLPAALGGRVIALCQGRIVADGFADDILTPRRLAEVYDAGFEMCLTPSGRQLVVPDWWNSGGGL